MRAIRSLGSLLLLAVLPPFQGGDRPDRPDRPDRDPPSRVGRLSYLSGSVSFRPGDVDDWTDATRSEEHTSELQSRLHLVCRLLLEKKKNKILHNHPTTC